MSLPKHPPSHSSSPSKSSLRSTSGTSTQKTPTGRALLPSPHFEESPPLARSEPVEEEEQEEEEQPGFPEPDGSNFQPFFTLIEDTTIHTHHHPTVHYIFADDDTDIVTEAACRSLAQDDPFMNTAAAGSSEPTAQSQQHQDQDQELDPEPSKLPAPTSGVREHYLLLDVQLIAASPDSANTSYEVTRAHSLSAEWQVRSTSISNAPTIDAVDEDTRGAEGLMLRIEGRGIVPDSDDEKETTGKRGGGGKEKETLEEMVRRFETGLADIRRAINAGGSLGGEPEEEVGGSERAGI